ncbi:outer membrane lipoprotein carrier protein LolA, partial [Agrobacterium sp. S2]|nr:outer membrane lipoprotein carrier protein LolA [Agrobacterium sp. S2]
MKPPRFSRTIAAMKENRMNDLTTGETANASPAQNGVTRRGVLTAFSMAAVIAGISPLDAFAQAAGNTATAQKIANHFSSVKT